MPALAETPVNELEAKRLKLKEDLDRITELNRSASSLQGEIKALEAKIAEVTKAGQAYQAASDPLVQRLKKVTTSATQKVSLAQEEIKEDQKRVDKVVADFDGSLTAQEKEVKDAATEAATAAKTLLDAQTAAMASQEAYDALMSRAQTLMATITSAEGLLVQAEAAEKKNDYVALYFLATEAGKIVKDLTILAPDKYAAELQLGQDAASADKDKAAVAATRNDAAKSKLADAAGKHAAAKASRLTDLLQELRKAP
ncbi:hypothetical protein [Variovorax sp. JS1663]|uniref:hypothetical protein n=1 Tax=Variovorax sp. JS1663 TaxID=1851577 RepID=UPI000B3429DD|nr:hypothetical protein [Variovorax sp. JS1663]OUM02258.1 hypothetical protein A8M77_11255 [Variovorax sp. JS1663]